MIDGKDTWCMELTYLRLGGGGDLWDLLWCCVVMPSTMTTCLQSAKRCLVGCNNMTLMVFHLADYPPSSRQLVNALGPQRMYNMRISGKVSSGPTLSMSSGENKDSASCVWTTPVVIATAHG